MDPLTIAAGISAAAALGGFISGSKQTKRAKREAKLHEEDIKVQRMQYEETQKKLSSDLKRSREKTALQVARQNRARRRGGLFQNNDAQQVQGSPTLG